MTLPVLPTATIGGVELTLDPEAMSPEMINVIRSGYYEQGEAQELPRIIQPGERIVELGAGIGYIAITALRTGNVASLTSYEANPRLIPLIRRNAALNDVAFEVHNAVVDPREDGGTVPFYIRQDFWSSSLSPGPWPFVEEVAVPRVAFPRMLDRYRPSMLIVDIEGGEEFLFRDVPLTGVRKVYMELHQRVIGRIGMKNVFDFMAARDFHYDQWHSSGSVVLFSHVLR